MILRDNAEELALTAQEIGAEAITRTVHGAGHYISVPKYGPTPYLAGERHYARGPRMQAPRMTCFPFQR